MATLLGKMLLQKLQRAAKPFDATAEAVGEARRAARTLKKVPTTPESNMSLSNVLAKSRSVQTAMKAAKSTAAEVAPANSRVAQVNGMAASRAPAVQKAVSTGSNSAANNPKPEQVDTNGAITGGMKDPKLGEGTENPIGAASNMDNGWAAVQEFFANRRAK